MPARTLAKLRFEEEPALTIRAFTLQAQNQAAMTGSASCRRAQTRRHTKVNAQDASNAHLPRPPEMLALRAVLAGHEASWTSYFLRVRSRHRWIGAAQWAAVQSQKVKLLEFVVNRGSTKQVNLWPQRSRVKKSQSRLRKHCSGK